MDRIVNFGYFGGIRIFTLVVFVLIAFVEYLRIWINKVFSENEYERITGVTKFGKVWISAHVIAIVIITAVSWCELL